MEAGVMILDLQDARTWLSAASRLPSGPTLRRQILSLCSGRAPSQQRWRSSLGECRGRISWQQIHRRWDQKMTEPVLVIGTRINEGAGHLSAIGVVNEKRAAQLRAVSRPARPLRDWCNLVRPPRLSASPRRGRDGKRESSKFTRQCRRPFNKPVISLILHMSSFGARSDLNTENSIIPRVHGVNYGAD